MTRINLIKPELLTDLHLLAEHREITRVIALAMYSYKRGVRPNIKCYTLGQGHVKFFYDKLKFIEARYNSLYEECIKRGFKCKNKSAMFDDIPIEIYNDYKPDDNALVVNLGRILESVEKMNHYYNGTAITFEQYKQMLATKLERKNGTF